MAARLLHAHATGSLNARGAYLHVWGDLMGSIGALVAGAIVWATGWTPADSVVSVLIAVLLQNQNEIARYLREGDPTDDYFPYLERQVRFIRLSIILALILLILSILTPLIVPMLDLKPILFAAILLIPFGGLMVALSLVVLRDFH